MKWFFNRNLFLQAAQSQFLTTAFIFKTYGQGQFNSPLFFICSRTELLEKMLLIKYSFLCTVKV
jgi:hypothetical protein